MRYHSFSFLFTTLLIMVTAFCVSGCQSPDNHLTLVDIPSGEVAGVATEKGIMVLKTPTVKAGDIYDIEHIYRNGTVYDQARVIDTNEYLALLTPVSSQLNNCRVLLFPVEPDEELYVGVLDNENKAYYLIADLVELGEKGDLITCIDLEKYPRPTPEGYGGTGLFAFRDGSLWLAGILTNVSAEMQGKKGKVYPFVGLDKIWRFITEAENKYSREKKPFRPDFIYGVERDGTGE